MELYLEHHGILGQRWGVRRFQNADGSLTKAGAKRYGSSDQMGKTNKQIENRLNDLAKGMAYNERDVRDSHRTINALKNKYAKKTKDSGFDPDKALVTNNLSKRDAKILEKAKTKNKEAEKRIKEGQKEIDSILKDCGDKYIDVEAKEIKRDTTRGKENVGLALAVVGSIPLAVLPGPNAVGIASVLAVSNAHKENTVDSVAFKVKDKKDTRSKEQKEKDADNQRNANEILRYSNPKYHNDADKYIKELSDDEIKRQVRHHREARDHWNNMKAEDDYDRKENKKEARQYEKNAKRYEKELNRRSKTVTNKTSGGKQKLTKEQKNAQKKIKALERSRELFSERAKPKPGNVSLIYDETMEEFDKELKKYQKILNG